MPPVIQNVSRRDFLLAGGTTALAAIAVACGKSGSVGEGTLDAIARGVTQDVTILSAGTELLSSVSERVAYGVLSKQNELIAGLSGQCWVAKSRTDKALGPFEVTYHGDGLGARGVYEARITFPSDGQWLLFTKLTGPTGAHAGQVALQVGKQTAMPAPGDRAVVVPTPTVTDHRGVDPICTRKPACSMHAISLDDALANRKPTIVILATPAFCQSQLCGPEVDIVQSMLPSFGAKANFIHIEVYRDDKAATIQQQILSPAARSWRLDQEPAIYYIDARGTVAERALGPVDRADVRDALARLLAG